MYKIIITGVSVLAIALISTVSVADEMVYGNFPVTVQGYVGSKSTSVSYTGQIARHTLHDSLSDEPLWMPFHRDLLCAKLRTKFKHFKILVDFQDFRYFKILLIIIIFMN